MDKKVQENGASEVRPLIIGTPQLAVIALVLSLLTGIIFLTDTSIRSTLQSAGAAVALETEPQEEAAPNPFADVELEAKSVIALDLRDNEVLYEYNADTQLPLASLTKIALVLAVSGVLNPDAYVELANEAYSIGSADVLHQGEEWRVNDLIDYTLLSSSNGGATALAAAADAELHSRYPNAKTGEAALYRMNAIANELNLSNTYFLNTTGLDENGVVSGAYGSARDTAKLLARALDARDYFAKTADRKLVVWEAKGKKAAVAFNTNEALPVIPGLIFGKTGFTDLAGGNLAIVFEPEPAHPIAVVVLGSTEEGRFRDMEELVRRVRDAL